MDQLIRNGRVERAALGVTVRDITADDAAYAGLKSIGGVLVQDYASDVSPAKRAGIQPGDIILAVDGTAVDYVAQLQEAIAFRKPGSSVSVQVARKGGSRTTLNVTLDAAAGATADVGDRSTTRRMLPEDGSERAQLSVPALGIKGMKGDTAGVNRKRETS